jgi:hypothetical protein
VTGDRPDPRTCGDAARRPRGRCGNRLPRHPVRPSGSPAARRTRWDGVLDAVRPGPAAPQPCFYGRAGIVDLLAADGEALGDGRAGAGGGVVAGGGAQPAHGTGGERDDGLAAKVEPLGERRHDHGRSDVPDGAAQQHRVIAVDRGQRAGDGRAGVGVLFAYVPCDGLLVVGGVGVGGFDAVDVAVDAPADRPGDHLGVADLQVPASSVVVVLSRAGEVGQQDGLRGGPPGWDGGAAEDRDSSHHGPSGQERVTQERTPFQLNGAIVASRRQGRMRTLSALRSAMAR